MLFRVKIERGERTKGHSNSLVENKLPMPWHKKQKISKPKQNTDNQKLSNKNPTKTVAITGSTEAGKANPVPHVAPVVMLITVHTWC